MSILAEAVAGDHSGPTEIRIKWLWNGMTAEKFQGLHFIKERAKYEAQQIRRVVHLSEETTKTFLGSAVAGLAGGILLGGVGVLAGVLVGGKKKLLNLGVELDDGTKVVLLQSASNRPLQCLLMYAEKNGILEKRQDLGF